MESVDSSGDKYICNCTGTNYIGSNCSGSIIILYCTYQNSHTLILMSTIECQECPLGYAAELENNCTCYETHICLVNSPCENGATCNLMNGDTNYTCTCADNFTGMNCTGT